MLDALYNDTYNNKSNIKREFISTEAVQRTKKSYLELSELYRKALHERVETRNWV